MKLRKTIIYDNPWKEDVDENEKHMKTTLNNIL
jgi:hypothetical protein